MRKIIVILILLFVHVSLFSADNLYFKFGTDILTKTKYNDTFRGNYDISTVGYSLGIIIPIIKRPIYINYQVDANIHNINFQYKHVWYKPYNSHLYGSNAISFGKLIELKNFSIIPSLGIGVQVESLYTTATDGYFSSTYNALFFDYSLILLRKILLNTNCGILIKYKDAVFRCSEVYDATDRFELALIISI